MLKLQEIYKLCEGFENQNRELSTRKLIKRGYSEEVAVSYYNIWRRHYLETKKDDLKLSGVYINSGEIRKPIEECSYEERQEYLKVLSKEQLIKITQAVLK